MNGLPGGLPRVIVAFVLAIVTGPAFSASAPDWPVRPVRIVAPFAPGGSADTLGRVVAEKLTVKFKQNFIVDNRAGAGGVVGSELGQAARPTVTPWWFPALLRTRSHRLCREYRSTR